MTFQELTQKKVAGVPVLYLAAAAVTILAVVAWRMKPAPEVAEPATDPLATDADGDGDIDGVVVSPTNPYAGYNTNGTIVVAPVTPTPAEPVVKTNETWMQDAAAWLVSSKKATGTEAARALQKFIDGEDLSYEEGDLVNAAISEKGQPPEALGKIGAIGTQPARRQFNGSTGWHTVMGPNDNTYPELAQLYYGNADAIHVNTIVRHNVDPNLGPATTTFNPGTKVRIPSFVNPLYYTVTGKNGDNRFGAVGAKQGITTNMVRALNPSLTEPIPVGTKVRIL